MNTMDKVNVRRLLQDIEKQMRLIVSNHVGDPMNSQTCDHIRSRINSLSIQKEFEGAIEDHKVKIRQPRYNDDSDIRTSSGYDEYLIRKHMKNQAPISEPVYKEQVQLEPGQLNITTTLKLAKQTELVHVNLKLNT